jgi:hypothetical protein
MPLMSKKMIIIAFTCDLLFSISVKWVSSNALTNSSFLPEFHKKFQIDVLLNFHPSHESNRTAQHGHTQTKVRGKLTDTERRVQSPSI